MGNTTDGVPALMQGKSTTEGRKIKVGQRCRRKRKENSRIPKKWAISVMAKLAQCLC